MKKLVISLFLIVVAFMTNSCNDFLNVQPQSEYNADNLYKTSNDFELALNGVYSVQQGLWVSGNTGRWYRTLIDRSDDAHASDLNSLFNDNQLTTDPLDGYNIFWKMINFTNIILDKVVSANLSDSIKNNIKGQAYILRGFAYSNLGCYFGGMPIIVKNLKPAEILKIPRSTQAATIDTALADYRKAVQLLPAKWTGKNIGRPTRYAAQGMLARLLLFPKNILDGGRTQYLDPAVLTEAKNALEDIINSGYYQMEPVFENCFMDNYDNGPERVWEIQFTGGMKGEGQSFAQCMIPANYPGGIYSPFGGYPGMLTLSLDLSNSFDMYDHRRAITESDDPTVGTRAMIKFNRFYYIPQTTTDWANNLPILRYTDVLLMYAEVLNELNFDDSPNSPQLKILNDIRKYHAQMPTAAQGGGDYFTTTPNQFQQPIPPTQDKFRAVIKEERRLELAFEGQRWYDLLRWGIQGPDGAWAIMNNYLLSEITNGTAQMNPDYHSVLFAIPFSQLNAYNDKSVMWQNPGY